MPFVNRFFLNSNGAVTYTGNTLGLSRSNTVGVPGTVDSIGAFITTDTSQQFGSYPAGTTGDFMNNSSTAILQIPAGSTILYAELIWGGTYIDNGVDLSAFIDDPVSLTTPGGSFSIAPDPITAFNVLLSAPSTFAYVRSAEVTALVQAAGAGSYTAAGIVGTIVIPDPTTNHAGWTLGVVYQNNSLPLRNLSIRVGADVILATSGPISTVITGFATPFTGPLDARSAISAQEGDANKTGDNAQFGPTLATVVSLSGPNNFVNNFFASQLNKDDGTLDTSGTFGDRNQINGVPGTNIVGGRQSYDITNVDISATLQNAQTNAVFNLTTNGDGYLVNSIGIQIDIATPLLTIVKSANTQDTTIGDIVTYTVTVQNTGIVNAEGVEVFDIIDTEATFVPGSITLNGGPVPPNTTPDTGITVGILTPNQSAVITFQYQVTAIPFDGSIKDQAFVSFTFMPTPNSPTISTSIPSNIVELMVFAPDITLEKSANVQQAVIGNPVTYTLVAGNAGNIAANVTVSDPLPVGSIFVAGSVTIDGVASPSANPVAGIPIGIIDPGGSSTITFTVLVVSEPPNNTLINQSTANFTYQPPDGRTIPGSTLSNQVVIPVINPMTSPVVSLVKSASISSGIVGEVVTFTVTATNNSIAGLLNAVLTDTIPAGYTFVTGTVTVAGVAVPAANPTTGIPIGLLPVSASVTVTFDLQITSIPSPPVLTNQANLQYDFLGIPYNTPSNLVDVTVLQPVISLLKRSSESEVVVGQIFNFSITVSNSGNVAADNIIVTDLLNPYLSFVAGSVRINGTSFPAESPITGIAVGTVAPGGSTIVSFDVQLISQPPTQFMENQASATFTFESPQGTVGTGSAVSNIVLIEDPLFRISVVKTESEQFALVGDRITITVAVTNNGILPADDSVVTDFSTNGAAFVPGSVTVNGVSVPGDINLGINIGTVAPGATVTVTFQEDILNIVQPSEIVDDFVVVTFTEGGVPGSAISNTAEIIVTQPIISTVKRAKESFAFVGDVVHYETDVTNTGSFNADVTWFDVLPEGSIFVQNSFTLDGFPDAGVNMLTGAFLGTIEANETGFITFKLQVVSYPPTGQLLNQGRLVFSYTLPDGRSFTLTNLTNPVIVPVLALPTLVKSANITDVMVGGFVTYTLVIANPNIAALQNVILTDTLPAGLSFVTGSLKVNGVTSPSASLTNGVAIGSVPAKGQVTVSFLAKADFEPANPVTTNSAAISFDLVLPDGQLIARSVVSNPVNVTIEEEEE